MSVTASKSPGCFCIFLTLIQLRSAHLRIFLFRTESDAWKTDKKLSIYWKILLRAGYEIGLYQFLIIAYLFTLLYPQTFMPGLWIKTLFFFFCPFGILIALLGEEGAGLCVCRAFVCWLCTRWSVSLLLFLLVLGVGCHFDLWLFLYFSVYIFYFFLCVFCESHWNLASFFNF